MDTVVTSISAPSTCTVNESAGVGVSFTCPTYSSVSSSSITVAARSTGRERGRRTASGGCPKPPSMSIRFTPRPGIESSTA